MKAPAIRAAAVMAAMVAASPALAHPGHPAGGFAAGVLHPFTGVDHLLAMVMVGLWSALAFPRRWWICPAAFVGCMALGFAWGAGGGTFPLAEALILASLAGLGLALLFDIRMPLAAAASVIGLFAVGHGFAHGAEVPAGAGAGTFAAGFILATISLHLAGIGLAGLATRLQTRRLSQTVGAAATVTAAVLLWAS